MEDRDREPEGPGSERPIRPQASERIERRIKFRIGTGLLVGAVVGALLGLIVGLLFFDGSGRQMLAATLGAAIAGLLVAGLWAGYSSLESPQPGAEPSEVDRPIKDRPEAARTEHPSVRDRAREEGQSSTGTQG